MVTVAGLRRDLRPLRLAGLALLFAALGKLVLYDLAALGAVPDLRSVPPGLR